MPLLSDKVSSDAMEVLLHALGYERGTQSRSEGRNRYVDTHDAPPCAELVAAGLMRAGVCVAFLPPDERLFRATERGESVARAEHERTRPRLTRGRRRYLRWLEISDVCSDLSFGAFLRRPELHGSAGSAGSAHEVRRG